ncbi:MAG: hypothetical protein PHD01_15430, partial [Geobacteraceae bacterium]|nr:hypothetical protein [Geobacteraceae bacterium]
FGFIKSPGFESIDSIPGNFITQYLQNTSINSTCYAFSGTTSYLIFFSMIKPLWQVDDRSFPIMLLR